MQSTLDGQIHLAIIMDGNRRWAAERGLGHVQGHEAGAEALGRIVEVAPNLGVGTLTVYAFASENWRRPKEETAAMMALFHRHSRHRLSTGPQAACHAARHRHREAG